MWNKPQHDSCSCLMPNARHILRGRRRPILGWERLALQGVPSTSYDYAGTTHEAATQLAGEAMSAFSLMLVNVAFIHSVPMIWRFVEVDEDQ